MRIERIREERIEGRHRIAADVVHEDHDAPARTLIIETTELFARDLEPSPDAILVALLPLAQWLGERRIRIEGTICCRLRDGLGAAMHLFAFWYDRCRPVRLEPTGGFAPTVAQREPRAASFLSGGIDALSLLRCNRLDYPAGHPASIRDGILIFGMNTHDLDASGPRPARLAAFEAHARRMTSFAERAGVTLIPVRTNIRAFYPDFGSWTDVGFGAGTLSTALCMPGRFDRVHLASAGLGMRQPPRGSHPWLDHHYSTEAVAVHHAQTVLDRFEKTRIVAEWDDALSVLKSCFYERIPEDGRINCGECDKCVRTMLALVALGKLDRAPTFPFDDVTPSMLEPIRIDSRLGLLYYDQCFEALAARGRSDLATPLRRKIDAYRRHERRRHVLSFVRRVSGLR
ncbi:MAG TPA: hypothetical protein VMM18_14345 [Gemmatimonadaceae bacterium]|nr:hypothetical protein [Gemmatimonadaceae bacterium]